MSKLTQVLATVAISALGFATLTSAQAQEATPDYPQAVSSSLSRAQVQAELSQAKRNGAMRVWSTSYNHIAAAKSLKSRADVQAELLGGDRAVTAAITSEDGGSFAFAKQPALRAGTVIAGR